MELLTRIGHAFRYARLRKFTLGRLYGRPTSAVEVGRRRSLRKKRTERLCHRTATRQVFDEVVPSALAQLEVFHCGLCAFRPVSGDGQIINGRTFLRDWGRDNRYQIHPLL
jgi:hypothetical protein